MKFLDSWVMSHEILEVTMTEKDKKKAIKDIEKKIKDGKKKQTLSDEEICSRALPCHGLDLFLAQFSSGVVGSARRFGRWRTS